MDAQTHIAHRLQERVKELSALHQASEILQASSKDTLALLREFAQIIPPAWQYPHLAVVRIVYDGVEVTTADFALTDWKQEAHFTTTNGKKGTIEVCYRDFCPLESEGPFLKEERSLIDSLSKILCSYFNRKEFEDELKRANQELELRVRQRTQSLRRLTSTLLYSEERQRRSLATHLHDRIGQSLACLRFKLVELRSQLNSDFSHEHLDALVNLVEQTIKDTRSLTVEISPPALYELGLDAALEGLIDQMNGKHGMKISLENDQAHKPLSDDVKVVLFRSVSELLMNIVKHAGTECARVSIQRVHNEIQIAVSDEGCGFDVKQENLPHKKCFGLFSIKERLRDLGGSLDLISRQGAGTRAVITAQLLET